MEEYRSVAENVLQAAVAEGSVVFKGEGASLDLFGPFYGNGKKDNKSEEEKRKTKNKTPKLSLGGF
ncbi:hypothetical protein [Gilvibacter sediminis]|uniref:hypothetical protein n=1 Tax=Gilvibacter sediminis TaxID=379071 RepID=UPI00235054C0|nr:hypothetical protein [Gilvibacter sediminis]MDC7999403.1 hypothetical protein [Gilvibacter sediminis]